ncbi:MAG: DUF5309 family protein [Phycisphaerae bacterium]|jgi:hypothetical protein
MPTNSYKTTTAVGEREELSDIIAMIDPDETPIYSNAKKIKTNAVNTEWQVQELAAASASNAVNEGADATYATPTPTTRLGNYHQISTKPVSVSGTLDAVDKAGRESEIAYQKILKAKELRRDIEKTLFAPQAKSGSDPRKAATLSAWITNVDDNGATDATGDGTDFNGQTTSGTARALAISYIDNVMKLAYQDGGSPDMLVLSPTNKKNFSALAATETGVVANQINMTTPKPGTLVGTTSMYLTDFGTLEVVTDRFALDTDVYVLDSDYLAIGTLKGRNFMTQPLAKVGDAENFQLLVEWTLKVEAPKAHGAVYALSGS